MALTALAIKNAKPEAKSRKIADSQGLCLEIKPNGSKLWRYRYRVNSKEQMIGLGKWPEVSLEQARKKRDEARALLAEGKNPSRERKAQKMRQVLDGENTLQAVAKAWLEVWKVGKNAHYVDQTLTRMEQYIFPQLGALPITEITEPDIVRLIEKIGAKGTLETAHKIKRLLGQVFRYAKRRGMCQHNPASDMVGILPSAPEKHHPCIPPAEFPELLKKMAKYNGDPLTIAAMHLFALTFVRTGDLIGARWDEISLERAEWNIPAQRMKMKRPHIVPLSKQAVEVLKELLPLTGDKEHVFHSQRGKSKHISKGAVLMALRRMGYQGRMTTHGFRSLASSILNEKGYRADWIERQLAHNERNKVRGAYSYHAEYLLDRNKMMQDYANMLDTMRESDGKNVVTFAPKLNQGA